MNLPTGQSEEPDGLTTTVSAELLDALNSYIGAAKPGHFDELRNKKGELRGPWKAFFGHIGLSGFESLPECAQTIDRVIRTNGVTYNVYAESQDHARPWSLNPLPMLIDPTEWREISAGLAQRATLLNLILNDVYTSRNLLKASYLPSSLVLGNPGYLHALQGVTPVNGAYLHVVAFDLARGPDGRWWVVGQRTQAPSGLGYALENRLIVSRLFTQAYRDMKIQHIGSSYRRLLDALEAQTISIANGQTPKFALLSSGAYSETYFEHAYLARYMGIPLVEGADLTVRNSQVYLRTIHGLERIHGLLRRLDDDFCDPLELRADSALGVPGLLQAVRAGQVVIANALGTGFLESPSIQGFLPSISEHLLGEPLKIPSLHTWWCGEGAAWEDVSPHLGTQVIKPTFSTRQSTNFDPVIAALLNQEQLSAWRARIEQQPAIYTTQTYLPFSQVPTWRSNSIEPRAAMLRFYAIIGPDGSWQVMPGGMTRVAAVDPHVVSMRSGGSTLDTWVMTGDEVDTYSMLPTRGGLPRRYNEHELVSSRSAENLFWLGRYTERAETMLRCARESLVLLSINQRDSHPPLQQAMSELIMQQGLIAPDTPGIQVDPAAFGRNLMQRLWKPGVGGLYDTADTLERIMRSVRDRLPPEHVEIPGRIKDLLKTGQDATSGSSRRHSQYLIDAIEQLDRVEVPLAALVGFQLDRMTRDLGWRLLVAGRLIERLIHLSQVIDTFFRHAAVYSPRGFDSLLVLFDSTITFRSRYQRQQDILALLDLVAMDPTNPRSIVSVITDLRTHLRVLPDREAIMTQLPDLQWQEDAITSLISQIGEAGQAGYAMSDEIGKRLFAHVSDQHFAS